MGDKKIGYAEFNKLGNEEGGYKGKIVGLLSERPLTKKEILSNFNESSRKYVSLTLLAKLMREGTVISKYQGNRTRIKLYGLTTKVV